MAGVVQIPPLGLIKNIQRGTITLTGVATNTATITAVNTAKSILAILGTQGNTDNASTVAVGLTLTNATTITADRQNATGNATVTYQVVEYY